jgi:hypothetical protein
MFPLVTTPIPMEEARSIRKKLSLPFTDLVRMDFLSLANSLMVFRPLAASSATLNLNSALY